MPEEESSFTEEQRELELAQVGYLMTSFTIYGHEFVLRTLSAEEKVEALRYLERFSANAFSIAFPIETLCYAIEKMDGLPLAEGLRGNTEAERRADKIKTARALVGKWAPHVVLDLFEYYSFLETEQKRLVDELKKEWTPLDSVISTKVYEIRGSGAQTE